MFEKLCDDSSVLSGKIRWSLAFLRVLFAVKIDFVISSNAHVSTSDLLVFTFIFSSQIRSFQPAVQSFYKHEAGALEVVLASLRLYPRLQPRAFATLQNLAYELPYLVSWKIASIHRQ